MGQNYDTGGALRRPFEAPAGTGTLFGRTMRLVVGDRRPVHRGRLPRPQPVRRVGPGVLDRVAGLPARQLLAASIFLDILNVFQFLPQSSLGVALDGSDRPTDDAPNLTTGRRAHDAERE
jgi:hypothetical protein